MSAFGFWGQSLLNTIYNPFVIASNVPGMQAQFQNPLGIYNIGVGPFGGFAGAGFWGGQAFGPGSYATVRNPFGVLAHAATTVPNYNYGWFSA